MEAHTLHAEIITRCTQHGDRSFAHFLWLEQNPQCRSLEMEGLVDFLESQLDALSSDIPLFSTRYLFHLLPTAIELNGIINAFNQIETDLQVEPEIWKSDDVLGWLGPFGKENHSVNLIKQVYVSGLFTGAVYVVWIFSDEKKRGLTNLAPNPKAQERRRIFVRPR
jgi:hypothetical protein